MPANASMKPHKTPNRLRHYLILGMGVIGIGATPYLWPLAARADVLLISANANPQRFSVRANGQTDFLPLNKAGDKILQFATSKANQRVVITFSASCELFPGGDGIVGIQILVNPAGPVGEFIAPPTNNEFGSILCGGRSRDEVITGTTVVAVARPAKVGTNTVRVRLVHSGLGGFDFTVFAMSLSVIS